ncbi:MAG: hypothetical protein ACHQUC_00125 [Chlamydiales bacterium]
MASNQSISQSFFGPIMQFAKQDSTIKFVLKINDLVKKVSRVALIVFFAMHCLINCIHNPGTNFSFAYGFVATLILGTTYIISGVKSVFEDIEGQEKEEQVKVLADKIEADRRVRADKIEADRRVREEQETARIAQEEAERRFQAEQEEAARRLRAAELRETAERLAKEEAVRKEQEQRDLAAQEIQAMNNQMDAETTRLKRESGEAAQLATAKSEKELGEVREKAAAEVRAAQQARENEIEEARTELKELSGISMELRRAAQEKVEALEKADTDLRAEQVKHQLALREHSRIKNDEKEAACKILRQELGATETQRNRAKATLAEKIQEISELTTNLASLKSMLEKRNDDNNCLQQVLKKLFGDCLGGEAHRELFSVIRLATAANEEDILKSARSAHQKYNELFNTVLQTLTEQGIDLELGLELTRALKKATKEPDPSKLGIRDFVMHPVDTLRILTHSSSQQKPPQGSPSSSSSQTPHIAPNATQSPHSGPLNQASVSMLRLPTSSTISFCGSLGSSEINFQKEEITGDDNCGFAALGKTQEDVRDTLINLSRQVDIRDRLCDEIYEAVTTNAKAIITDAGERRFQSLRRWSETQGLWDQTLKTIRDKHEALLTFSAESDDDAVYHKSISWLRKHSRRLDAVDLEHAFSAREHAKGKLKHDCKSGEIYYHLYCKAYLNKLRLGCESAIILAEQWDFPLYIWEESPTLNHLRLKKSYSPSTLDQSRAVHLLYSKGNHFDRLVLALPSPLVVEMKGSPPPPPGSAGVSQDQSDDAQTKPAVQPVAELQGSTAATTSNKSSESDSFDEGDSNREDRASESSNLLSSSSSRDGESDKTNPRKKWFGIF